MNKYFCEPFISCCVDFISKSSAATWTKTAKMLIEISTESNISISLLHET